jgi:hypothetical protein
MLRAGSSNERLVSRARHRSVDHRKRRHTNRSHPAGKHRTHGERPSGRLEGTLGYPKDAVLGEAPALRRWQSDV